MTIQKPQTATLIDTVSEGYRAINRRPWLLLAPIALNVFLWFGMQLSLRPLVVSALGLWQRMQIVQPLPEDVQAQYDQWLLLGRMDMRQPLAILNYVPQTLYSLSMPGIGEGAFGMPMLHGQPRLIDERRTDLIEISTAGGAVLAFLIINTLALPLSAAFLTLVAAAVRGDRAPFTTMLGRMGRAALAILGCVGALTGIGLALGLPFIFLAALLVMLSPALGAFVVLLLFMAVFWIRIYLGFANEAIVVSGVGPLRALHASFNIVRRNFWGTMGLLALTLIIMAGGSVIWQYLATSAVGAIAAIVGSAYLGAGMLAARMAFYRERLRRWQMAAVPKGVADKDKDVVR